MVHSMNLRKLITILASIKKQCNFVNKFRGHICPGNYLDLTIALNSESDCSRKGYDPSHPWIML